AITYRNAGEDIIIPPSGSLARVACTERDCAPIGGLPIVRREWGEIEGLAGIECCNPENPARRPFAIVSSLVLDRAAAIDHPALPYLAAPDTGKTAMREAGGKILPVTRFVVASQIVPRGAAERTQ